MKPSTDPYREALSALPDFDPPPGGWSRVQQTLRPAPRRWRRTLAPLALAAGVSALAVGLGLRIGTSGVATPEAPTGSEWALQEAGDERVQLAWLLHDQPDLQDDWLAMMDDDTEALLAMALLSPSLPDDEDDWL